MCRRIDRFLRKGIHFQTNPEHDEKQIKLLRMSDEKDKDSSKEKEDEKDKSNNLPKPPPNRTSILRRSNNGAAGAKASAQRRFRFDEDNVKETYHPEGKDYGNMPIDEPPTPMPKKNKPIDPDTLNKRLEVLEKEQKEKEEEEEQRRKEFDEKRKKHYDEGSHMKDEKQYEDDK